MQVATTIDGDNGMVVKRLSVPIGLEELMESLTKQVLLKKPKDVYAFASQHFAHLLTIRDQKLSESSKANGPTSKKKPTSNPNGNIKIKSATAVTKFNKLPTPIIFTNSKSAYRTPPKTPQTRKSSKTSAEPSPRSLDRTSIKSSSSETSRKNDPPKQGRVGRARWKKQDPAKKGEKLPIALPTGRKQESPKKKPGGDADKKPGDGEKKTRTNQAIKERVRRTPSKEPIQRSISRDKTTPRSKASLSKSSSVEDDISVKGSSVSLGNKTRAKKPSRSTEKAVAAAAVIVPVAAVAALATKGLKVPPDVELINGINLEKSAGKISCSEKHSDDSSCATESKILIKDETVDSDFVDEDDKESVVSENSSKHEDIRKAVADQTKEVKEGITTETVVNTTEDVAGVEVKENIGSIATPEEKEEAADNTSADVTGIEENNGTVNNTTADVVGINDNKDGKGNEVDDKIIPPTHVGIDENEDEKGVEVDAKIMPPTPEKIDTKEENENAKEEITTHVDLQGNEDEQPETVPHVTLEENINFEGETERTKPEMTTGGTEVAHEDAKTDLTTSGTDQENAVAKGETESALKLNENAEDKITADLPARAETVSDVVNEEGAIPTTGLGDENKEESKSDIVTINESVGDDEAKDIASTYGNKTIAEDGSKITEDTVSTKAETATDSSKEDNEAELASTKVNEISGMTIDATKDDNDPDSSIKEEEKSGVTIDSAKDVNEAVIASTTVDEKSGTISDATKEINEAIIASNILDEKSAMTTDATKDVNEADASKVDEKSGMAIDATKDDNKADSSKGLDSTKEEEKSGMTIDSSKDVNETDSTKVLASTNEEDKSRSADLENIANEANDSKELPLDLASTKEEHISGTVDSAKADDNEVTISTEEQSARDLVATQDNEEDKDAKEDNNTPTGEMDTSNIKAPNEEEEEAASTNDENIMKGELVTSDATEFDQKSNDAKIEEEESPPHSQNNDASKQATASPEINKDISETTKKSKDPSIEEETEESSPHSKNDDEPKQETHISETTKLEEDTKKSTSAGIVDEINQEVKTLPENNEDMSDSTKLDEDPNKSTSSTEGNLSNQNEASANDLKKSPESGQVELVTPQEESGINRDQDNKAKIASECEDLLKPVVLMAEHQQEDIEKPDEIEESIEKIKDQQILSEEADKTSVNNQLISGKIEESTQETEEGDVDKKTEALEEEKESSDEEIKKSADDSIKETVKSDSIDSKIKIETSNYPEEVTKQMGDVSAENVDKETLKSDLTVEKQETGDPDLKKLADEKIENGEDQKNLDEAVKDMSIIHADDNEKTEAADNEGILKLMQESLGKHDIGETSKIEECDKVVAQKMEEEGTAKNEELEKVDSDAKEDKLKNDSEGNLKSEETVTNKDGTTSNEDTKIEENLLNVSKSTENVNVEAKAEDQEKQATEDLIDTRNIIEEKSDNEITHKSEVGEVKEGDADDKDSLGDNLKGVAEQPRIDDTKSGEGRIEENAKIDQRSADVDVEQSNKEEQSGETALENTKEENIAPSVEMGNETEASASINENSTTHKDIDEGKSTPNKPVIEDSFNEGSNNQIDEQKIETESSKESNQKDISTDSNNAPKDDTKVEDSTKIVDVAFKKSDEKDDTNKDIASNNDEESNVITKSGDMDSNESNKTDKILEGLVATTGLAAGAKIASDILQHKKSEENTSPQDSSLIKNDVPLSSNINKDNKTDLRAVTTSFLSLEKQNYEDHGHTKILIQSASPVGDNAHSPQHEANIPTSQSSSIVNIGEMLSPGDIDAIPASPVSGKSEVEDDGPLKLEDLSEYLKDQSGGEDKKDGGEEKSSSSTVEDNTEDQVDSIVTEASVSNDVFGHVVKPNVAKVEELKPQDVAATKIQSLWRGHKIRKIHERMQSAPIPEQTIAGWSNEDADKAATVIQAFVRGHLTRKQFHSGTPISSSAIQLGRLDSITEEKNEDHQEGEVEGMKHNNDIVAQPIEDISEAPKKSDGSVTLPSEDSKSAKNEDMTLPVERGDVISVSAKEGSNIDSITEENRKGEVEELKEHNDILEQPNEVISEALKKSDGSAASPSEDLQSAKHEDMNFPVEKSDVISASPKEGPNTDSITEENRKGEVEALKQNNDILEQPNISKKLEKGDGSVTLLIKDMQSASNEDMTNVHHEDISEAPKKSDGSVASPNKNLQSASNEDMTIEQHHEDISEVPKKSDHNVVSSIEDLQSAHNMTRAVEKGDDISVSPKEDAIQSLNDSIVVPAAEDITDAFKQSDGIAASHNEDMTPALKLNNDIYALSKTDNTFSSPKDLTETLPKIEESQANIAEDMKKLDDIVIPDHEPDVAARRKQSLGTEDEDGEKEKKSIFDSMSEKLNDLKKKITGNNVAEDDELQMEPVLLTGHQIGESEELKKIDEGNEDEVNNDKIEEKTRKDNEVLNDKAIEESENKSLKDSLSHRIVGVDDQKEEISDEPVLHAHDMIEESKDVMKEESKVNADVDKHIVDKETEVDRDEGDEVINEESDKDKSLMDKLSEKMTNLKNRITGVTDKANEESVEHDSTKETKEESVVKKSKKNESEHVTIEETKDENAKDADNTDVGKHVTNEDSEEKSGDKSIMDSLCEKMTKLKNKVTDDGKEETGEETPTNQYTLENVDSSIFKNSNPINEIKGDVEDTNDDKSADSMTRPVEESSAKHDGTIKVDGNKDEERMSKVEDTNEDNKLGGEVEKATEVNVISDILQKKAVDTNDDKTSTKNLVGGMLAASGLATGAKVISDVLQNKNNEDKVVGAEMKNVTPAPIDFRALTTSFLSLEKENYEDHRHRKMTDQIEKIPDEEETSKNDDPSIIRQLSSKMSTLKNRLMGKSGDNNVDSKEDKSSVDKNDHKNLEDIAKGEEKSIIADDTEFDVSKEVATKEEKSIVADDKELDASKKQMATKEENVNFGDKKDLEDSSKEDKPKEENPVDNKDLDGSKEKLTVGDNKDFGDISKEENKNSLIDNISDTMSSLKKMTGKDESYVKQDAHKLPEDLKEKSNEETSLEADKLNLDVTNDDKKSQENEEDEDKESITDKISRKMSGIKKIFKGDKSKKSKEERNGEEGGKGIKSAKSASFLDESKRSSALDPHAIDDSDRLPNEETDNSSEEKQSNEETLSDAKANILDGAKKGETEEETLKKPSEESEAKARKSDPSLDKPFDEGAFEGYIEERGDRLSEDAKPMASSAKAAEGERWKIGIGEEKEETTDGKKKSEDEEEIHDKLNASDKTHTVQDHPLKIQHNTYTIEDKSAKNEDDTEKDVSDASLNATYNIGEAPKDKHSRKKRSLDFDDNEKLENEEKPILTSNEVEDQEDNEPLSKPNEAASKIQKLFKDIVTRNKTTAHNEDAATEEPQKQDTGLKKLSSSGLTKAAAATVIQSLFRGYNARNKNMLPSKSMVEESKKSEHNMDTSIADSANEYSHFNKESHSETNQTDLKKNEDSSTTKARFEEDVAAKNENEAEKDVSDDATYNIEEAPKDEHSRKKRSLDFGDTDLKKNEDSSAKKPTFNEDVAATVIQSVFRGYNIRRKRHISPIMTSNNEETVSAGKEEIINGNEQPIKPEMLAGETATGIEHKKDTKLELVNEESYHKHESKSIDTIEESNNKEQPTEECSDIKRGLAMTDEEATEEPSESDSVHPKKRLTNKEDISKDSFGDRKKSITKEKEPSSTDSVDENEEPLEKSITDSIDVKEKRIKMAEQRLPTDSTHVKEETLKTAEASTTDSIDIKEETLKIENASNTDSTDATVVKEETIKTDEASITDSVSVEEGQLKKEDEPSTIDHIDLKDKSIYKEEELSKSDSISGNEALMKIQEESPKGNLVGIKDKPMRKIDNSVESKEELTKRGADSSDINNKVQNTDEETPKSDSVDTRKDLVISPSADSSDEKTTKSAITDSIGLKEETMNIGVTSKSECFDADDKPMNNKEKRDSIDSKENLKKNEEELPRTDSIDVKEGPMKREEDLSDADSFNVKEKPAQNIEEPPTKDSVDVKECTGMKEKELSKDNFADINSKPMNKKVETSKTGTADSSAELVNEEVETSKPDYADSNEEQVNEEIETSKGMNEIVTSKTDFPESSEELVNKEVATSKTDSSDSSEVLPRDNKEPLTVDTRREPTEEAEEELPITNVVGIKEEIMKKDSVRNDKPFNNKDDLTLEHNEKATMEEIDSLKSKDKDTTKDLKKEETSKVSNFLEKMKQENNADEVQSVDAREMKMHEDINDTESSNEHKNAVTIEDKSAKTESFYLKREINKSISISTTAKDEDMKEEEYPKVSKSTAGEDVKKEHEPKKPESEGGITESLKEENEAQKVKSADVYELQTKSINTKLKDTTNKEDREQQFMKTDFLDNSAKALEEEIEAGKLKSANESKGEDMKKCVDERQPNSVDEKETLVGIEEQPLKAESSDLIEENVLPPADSVTEKGEEIKREIQPKKSKSLESNSETLDEARKNIGVNEENVEKDEETIQAESVRIKREILKDEKEASDVEEGEVKTEKISINKEDETKPADIRVKSLHVEEDKEIKKGEDLTDSDTTNIHEPRRNAGNELSKKTYTDKKQDLIQKEEKSTDVEVKSVNIEDGAGKDPSKTSSAVEKVVRLEDQPTKIEVAEGNKVEDLKPEGMPTIEDSEKQNLKEETKFKHADLIAEKVEDLKAEGMPSKEGIDKQNLKEETKFKHPEINLEEVKKTEDSVENLKIKEDSTLSKTTEVNDETIKEEVNKSKYLVEKQKTEGIIEGSTDAKSSDRNEAYDARNKPKTSAAHISENEAATKIQSLFRGYVIRNKQKLLADCKEEKKKENDAALKIQKLFLSYMEKHKKKTDVNKIDNKSVDSKKEDNHRMIEEHAATKIQSLFRGFTIRNRKNIAELGKDDKDGNEERRNEAALKIQRVFHEFMKRNNKEKLDVISNEKEASKKNDDNSEVETLSKLNNEVKMSEEQAATKIQSLFRGFVLRNKKNIAGLVKDDDKDGNEDRRNDAALKIQRVFHEFMKKNNNGKLDIKSGEREASKKNEDKSSEISKQKRDSKENMTEEQAATKIQSLFRGFMLRNKKNIAELSKDGNEERRNDAALKIQRVFHEFMKKNNSGKSSEKNVFKKNEDEPKIEEPPVQKKEDKPKMTEEHAATKIQSLFRGFVIRNKKKIVESAKADDKVSNEEGRNEAALKIQRVFHEFMKKNNKDKLENDAFKKKIPPKNNDKIPLDDSSSPKNEDTHSEANLVSKLKNTSGVEANVIPEHKDTLPIEESLISKPEEDSPSLLDTQNEDILQNSTLDHLNNSEENPTAKKHLLISPTDAAVKIQSAFRGYTKRNKYLEHKNAKLLNEEKKNFEDSAISDVEDSEDTHELLDQIKNSLNNMKSLIERKVADSEDEDTIDDKTIQNEENDDYLEELPSMEDEGKKDEIKDGEKNKSVTQQAAKEDKEVKSENKISVDHLKNEETSPLEHLVPSAGIQTKPFDNICPTQENEDKTISTSSRNEDVSNRLKSKVDEDNTYTVEGHVKDRTFTIHKKPEKSEDDTDKDFSDESLNLTYNIEDNRDTSKADLGKDESPGKDGSMKVQEELKKSKELQNDSSVSSLDHQGHTIGKISIDASTKHEDDGRKLEQKDSKETKKAAETKFAAHDSDADKVIEDIKLEHVEENNAEVVEKIKDGEEGRNESIQPISSELDSMKKPGNKETATDTQELYGVMKGGVEITEPLSEAKDDGTIPDKEEEHKLKKNGIDTTDLIDSDTTNIHEKRRNAGDDPSKKIYTDKKQDLIRKEEKSTDVEVKSVNIEDGAGKDPSKTSSAVEKVVRLEDQPTKIEVAEGNKVEDLKPEGMPTIEDSEKQNLKEETKFKDADLIAEKVEDLKAERMPSKEGSDKQNLKEETKLGHPEINLEEVKKTEDSVENGIDTTEPFSVSKLEHSKNEKLHKMKEDEVKTTVDNLMNEDRTIHKMEEEDEIETKTHDTVKNKGEEQKDKGSRDLSSNEEDDDFHLSVSRLTSVEDHAQKNDLHEALDTPVSLDRLTSVGSTTSLDSAVTVVLTDGLDKLSKQNNKEEESLNNLNTKDSKGGQDDAKRVENIDNTKKIEDSIERIKDDNKKMLISSLQSIDEPEIVAKKVSHCYKDKGNLEDVSKRVLDAVAAATKIQKMYRDHRVRSVKNVVDEDRDENVSNKLKEEDKKGNEVTKQGTANDLLDEKNGDKDFESEEKAKVNEDKRPLTNIEDQGTENVQGLKTVGQAEIRSGEKIEDEENEILNAKDVTKKVGLVGTEDKSAPVEMKVKSGSVKIDFIGQDETKKSGIAENTDIETKNQKVADGEDIKHNKNALNEDKAIKASMPTEILHEENKSSLFEDINIEAEAEQMHEKLESQRKFEEEKSTQKSPEDDKLKNIFDDSKELITDINNTTNQDGEDKKSKSKIFEEHATQKTILDKTIDKDQVPEYIDVEETRGLIKPQKESKKETAALTSARKSQELGIRSRSADFEQGNVYSLESRSNSIDAQHSEDTKEINAAEENVKSIKNLSEDKDSVGGECKRSMDDEDKVNGAEEKESNTSKNINITVSTIEESGAEKSKQEESSEEEDEKVGNDSKKLQESTTRNIVNDEENKPEDMHIIEDNKLSDDLKKSVHAEVVGKVNATQEGLKGVDKPFTSKPADDDAKKVIKEKLGVLGNVATVTSKKSTDSTEDLEDVDKDDDFKQVSEEQLGINDSIALEISKKSTDSIEHLADNDKELTTINSAGNLKQVSEHKVSTVESIALATSTKPTDSIEHLEDDLKQVSKEKLGTVDSVAMITSNKPTESTDHLEDKDKEPNTIHSADDDLKQVGEEKLGKAGSVTLPISKNPTDFNEHLADDDKESTTIHSADDLKGVSEEKRGIVESIALATSTKPTDSTEHLEDEDKESNTLHSADDLKEVSEEKLGTVDRVVTITSNKPTDSTDHLEDEDKESTAIHSADDDLKQVSEEKLSTVGSVASPTTEKLTESTQHLAGDDKESTTILSANDLKQVSDDKLSTVESLALATSTKPTDFTEHPEYERKESITIQSADDNFKPVSEEKVAMISNTKPTNSAEHHEDEVTESTTIHSADDDNEHVSKEPSTVEGVTMATSTKPIDSIEPLEDEDNESTTINSAEKVGTIQSVTSAISKKPTDSTEHIEDQDKELTTINSADVDLKKVSEDKLDTVATSKNSGNSSELDKDNQSTIDGFKDNFGSVESVLLATNKKPIDSTVTLNSAYDESKKISKERVGGIETINNATINPKETGNEKSTLEQNVVYGMSKEPIGFASKQTDAKSSNVDTKQTTVEIPNISSGHLLGEDIESNILKTRIQNINFDTPQTSTNQKPEPPKKSSRPKLGDFIRSLAESPKLSNDMDKLKTKSEEIGNSVKLENITKEIDQNKPEPFYLHQPNSTNENPIAAAIRVSSRATNQEPSIGLLHSGEFHDTIPLNFTPSNINVVVHDQRTSSRNSRTPPSPGLRHSGELHDGGLFPQGMDAPAGAAPVTSSSSARAQASLGPQDASGGAVSESVIAMDAKRNNATILEKNEEAQAATKIQASFRGYQVRKQMKGKDQFSSPEEISANDPPQNAPLAQIDK